MPPALPAVPAPSGHLDLVVPGLVVDAGDDAAARFIEFFTATIRNANTRHAYGRAVGDFFAWCGQSGIGPLPAPALQPVHVAAWVEDLGRRQAPADRQAVPGRGPHAVRLVGHRPGNPP